MKICLTSTRETWSVLAARSHAKWRSDIFSLGVSESEETFADAKSCGAL